MEDTVVVMRHKFLRDWDHSRDAIVYPPAAGRYSVFSSSDIIKHMSHIVVAVSLHAYYCSNPSILVLFVTKRVVCKLLLRYITRAVLLTSRREFQSYRICQNSSYWDMPWSHCQCRGGKSNLGGCKLVIDKTRPQELLTHMWQIFLFLLNFQIEKPTKEDTQQWNTCLVCHLLATGFIGDEFVPTPCLDLRYHRANR